MSADKSNASHGPNIIIDKEHYQAPSDAMAGSALKALGSIKADFRLFKITPGPEPDEPIGDGEIVKLANGDQFYSLPPGRVGYQEFVNRLLPSVQSDIAEVLASFPEALIHAGEGTAFYIEIPRVRLPPGKGWDQGQTRILVPVPSGYPTSRPPNFFVDDKLTRAGGQVAGGKGGGEPLVGAVWASMCWSPAHSEEARTSLLACVRFAVARFQEAQ